MTVSIDFESTSSQALDMPANSQLARNRSDISLCAWVLPESIQNANVVGVSTNNGGVPTSNTRCAMKIEAGGEIQGQLRAPDAAARVDGSSAAGDITAGALQHMVCAFDVDGDDLKIYKNGAQVADPAVAYTNAATDNTDSASGTLAAEEDGAAPFYDGELHDVLAYSLKLSADLVSTIYACKGAVIPYFGLISRWQLKELGGGTTVPAGAGVVKDQGPAQQHLTRIGTPAYSVIRLRFRKPIG